MKTCEKVEYRKEWQCAQDCVRYAVRHIAAMKDIAAKNKDAQATLWAILKDFDEIAMVLSAAKDCIN